MVSKCHTLIDTLMQYVEHLGICDYRYKGDTKLEPSDRVIYEKEGNNYALVLKNVNLTEAGTYTVKAIADLGTISADATLTVKGM